MFYILFCFQLHLYLWADVEVAVDGQNWVVSVLNSFRKQPVTAALQESFQQVLSWGIKKGLLTVWCTNVLGRADWSGIFYFLEMQANDSVLYGVSCCKKIK